MHELLLTGGRVVDPANGIDGPMCVAVSDGRVAAVEERIDPATAREVHDVAGAIVAPGLIDLHTHVYHLATSYGVNPDPISARSGVTTLVDAGSAGAGNFAGFMEYVIRPSRFRILAYLNISFPGIFAFDREVMFGEAGVLDLLSVSRCVEVARQHRDSIIGVKVRLGCKTSDGLGMRALDRAMEAAERLDLPIMTHIGKPPPSYAEILERLRPGDVLTHCYRPAPNAPVDETGNILPALRDARERGVLFDIGHGMGAFGFESCEHAIASDFPPDIISSDVHALCVDGPAFDLLHTMSKLVACGIALPNVIGMATAAPATAIRRPELGHLAPGAPADITVLEEVAADYPFLDVGGGERQGQSLLKVGALYRDGRFIAPQPRTWEEERYVEGGRSGR